MKSKHENVGFHMVFREKVKVFIDIGKEGIYAKSMAVSCRYENTKDTEEEDERRPESGCFALFNRECHVCHYGLRDYKYFIRCKLVYVQVCSGIYIGGIKKQAVAV